MHLTSNHHLWLTICSWYETHPHVEYPGPQNTVCIGLCVGQLSAAAISLSANLLQLIPLAVEAVRVAVNLGSLVFMVRDDLESDVDGLPWALMVENEIINKQLLDLSSNTLVWHFVESISPYLTRNRAIRTGNKLMFLQPSRIPQPSKGLQIH